MHLPAPRCLLAALLGGLLAACTAGVNGPVQVPPGSQAERAATVNGAVEVGADARVAEASSVNGAVRLAAGAHADEASTVNGSIELGERASAGKLTTVNGGIRLAAGAEVSGDVTAVNGSLELASGAKVAGRLGNVNGRISVAGGEVGNGIHTIDGDINVGPRSLVAGGIAVDRPADGGRIGIRIDGKHVPRVVIGPGATVRGGLRFEREVRLYVSEEAVLEGGISGATAIRFAGAEPPTD